MCPVCMEVGVFSLHGVGCVHGVCLVYMELGVFMECV